MVRSSEDHLKKIADLGEKKSTPTVNHRSMTNDCQRPRKLKKYCQNLLTNPLRVGETTRKTRNMRSERILPAFKTPINGCNTNASKIPIPLISAFQPFAGRLYKIWAYIISWVFFEELLIHWMF